MKHIFILNPAAGKGRAEKDFPHKIIETCKKLGVEYEMHRTMGRGDGENFVRGRCKARTMQEDGTVQGDSTQEALRFYACGGDGTLNEVVNGVFGYENVEIGVIPTGTGNDFIRNFTHQKSFLDVEKQISGEAIPVDLIRYEFPLADYLTDSPEEVKERGIRYGINMFNIGLDSDVVIKVADLKKKPFIAGPTAYALGVAIVLGKKEGVSLKAEFDDGTIREGDILVIDIANGCYCGGGFKATPLASLNDGLIDVSIVEMITRRTFLSIIDKYRKGTHLDMPKIEEIITYKQCKAIHLTSEKDMRVSVDGEISMLKELYLRAIPGALQFSLPQGCQ